jgi:hypothetical protein
MGDGVAKNLAKNVQDGDVLNVGANGNIVTIDTTTRSLADYSADEQMWAENTQQKSFSFEVATGEAMPSGTPFRLGAVLSNSVNSYYERQKEIFGIFLKRLMMQKIIPIFQSKAKDYTHIISRSEEGYKVIFEAMVECYKSKYYMDLALSPSYYTEDIIPEGMLEEYLKAEINKSPVAYISSDKDLYKYAKYDLQLDVTGESNNTLADSETLTTIYQTMVQAGDPRKDEILDQILLTKGKSLKSLVGKAQPVSMANQQPQFAQ